MINWQYVMPSGKHAKQTQAEVFDSYIVVSESGCLEWRGKKFTNGYGCAIIRGKYMLAHRVAYERAFGEIPSGLYICHHCDNPACVRPDHLFAGTTSDNARDMIAKGRNNPPRGERSGKAKLTAIDVLEIRRLYAGGGHLQRELAERYGVTSKQISKIITREQWNWLNDEGVAG